MPGRIKTAPSGAIVACGSGSIFAGCDPCGDDSGCGFRVISGRYILLRLNLVQYTTGIPVVDSEGVPLEDTHGNYIKKRYHTHYWGEAKDLAAAGGFCEAANQEGGGESAVSNYITLRSNLPEGGSPQTVQTDLTPVYVTTPSLPKGLLSISATSTLLYPASTASLRLSALLATDSETAFSVAPARIAVSIPIRTDHISNELCDQKLNVTVIINKQFVDDVGGGIGLTVNIPYGSGVSPEHAIRCQYFATGYTQDSPNQITVSYGEYDGFPHEPFTDWFGGPTSFSSTITYDQFGVQLGNVVFRRPGHAPITMYTPPQFAESDSSGVILGAGTAASGSIFLTAYFGLCPGLPPPRLRVGVGSGGLMDPSQDLSIYDPWYGCGGVASSFQTYARNGALGGVIPSRPDIDAGLNKCYLAAAFSDARGYTMPVVVYPGDPVFYNVVIYYAINRFDFGGWRYEGPSNKQTTASGLMPVTMDPYVVRHFPSSTGGTWLFRSITGGFSLSPVAPVLRN